MIDQPQICALHTNKAGMRILVAVPPAVHTITVQYPDKASCYTLPFPELLYFITWHPRFQKAYFSGIWGLASINGRPFETSEVYPVALPNIGIDGTVCMGHQGSTTPHFRITPLDIIQDCVSSFWDSQFNLDVTDVCSEPDISLPEWERTQDAPIAHPLYRNDVLYEDTWSDETCTVQDIAEKWSMDVCRMVLTHPFLTKPL